MSRAFLRDDFASVLSSDMPEVHPTGADQIVELPADMMCVELQN